jgi:Tol biopolymer transport system component
VDVARTIVVLGALALFLAGGAGGATRSRVETVVLSSGQIAFDSINDNNCPGDTSGMCPDPECPGDCHVEVMNGDGSGRRTVGHGELPSWSPDGSRLAYWRYESGGDGETTRLSVIDMRTGRRRDYLRLEYPEAAPAWSRDGSAIAFVAPFGHHPFVGFVTLSSGRVVRLASLATPESSSYRALYFHAAVAWTPDGSSILYTSPSGQLDAVPVTGGLPKAVTSTYADNPAFSPDGSTLAFDEDARWVSLWVADPDGSNQRPLLNGGLPPDNKAPASAGPPNWSSDGSRIAFSETRAACGYHVCDAFGYPCSEAQGRCADAPMLVLAVGDDTAEPLTPDRGADENPVWSPNDHWLVFDRGGLYVGDGIWRVHPDGTCLRRLAGNLPGATRDAPSDPAWRPGAGSPPDACS